MAECGDNVGTCGCEKLTLILEGNSPSEEESRVARALGDVSTRGTQDDEGAGAENSEGGQANGDVINDGENYRSAKKEIGFSAITRQFELACRIFSIQKDISDNWDAYQRGWTLANIRGMTGDNSEMSRDISADHYPGSIYPMFSNTMQKTSKAALVSTNRMFRSYGVSRGRRENWDSKPWTNDITITTPAAITHGVHHLIKNELNRYYRNDDAQWEARTAAYHKGSQKPDAVFALLGDAQAAYSSVASMAMQQKQRNATGSGIFSIIGGVIGGIYGGPGGAAAGSAIGGAIDGR